MKNLAKLCVCFLLCFHVSSVTAQQYSVRHIGVLGKHVVPTFISNRGDVVGYFYLDRTVTHAFLWTRSGGIQDLGTLGGAISAATGINDTTVSQTLRHLRASQTVIAERDGRVVRYRLASTPVTALLAAP